LGTLIGGVIAHPERYGFDFAFAAVFLVVLFGLWKHQRRLLPIIASAAAALIVWKLVPGSGTSSPAGWRGHRRRS